MINDNAEYMSITLTNEDNYEVQCSAIFHKDPNYLSFNRITLLGDQSSAISLMRLHSGVIQFQLVERTKPSDQKFELSGEGYFRSVGAQRSGPGIDKTTIYETGDFVILNSTKIEGIHSQQPMKPYAVFTFTQSASYWPTPPLSRHWTGEIEHHGKKWDRWAKPRGVDLKFRPCVNYKWIDKDYTSQTEERFWLPGVELQPSQKSNLTAKAFHQLVDEFWDYLRVSLAFYFKKKVFPVSKLEIWPSYQCTKEWTKELDLEQPQEFDEPIFRDLLPLQFLSKTAAYTRKHILELDPLHLAVHSYTSAQNQMFLESSLSSYVEGIQSILELFERQNKLLRQVLSDPNEIKKYRAATKKVTKGLSFLAGNSREQKLRRAPISQHLNYIPNLTLEQRIERMTRHYWQDFGSNEKSHLADNSQMIRARNDIAHGRAITDTNMLFRENLRAKALFEKLFLCVVGCSTIEISSQSFFGLVKNSST